MALHGPLCICPKCWAEFTQEPLKAPLPMTPTPDKSDTSALGRVDLASGKSAPAPIEECISTWAVDDRIQSLIAENERLRETLAPFASIKAGDGDDFSNYDPQTIIRCEVTAGDIHTARAALSHKDMSK